MYRFGCKKKNYSLHSATTFRNLQQADFLQVKFDSRGYKSKHRYPTRFGAKLQYKLHVVQLVMSVILVLMPPYRQYGYYVFIDLVVGPEGKVFDSIRVRRGYVLPEREPNIFPSDPT